VAANHTIYVELVADIRQFQGGLRSAAGQLQSFDQATTRTGSGLNTLGAGADRSGGRISRSLDGVRSAAAGMSAGMTLAGAAGGAAMVKLGRDSSAAASGLNEQLAATRTLFKGAADEMVEFGKSAASIGLSERAALQAGNAFGDLFTKIGYTHDASQVFSEDLVRMAADFASFKDLDPEDVLGKLRSGLTGETEPLRALGVFLNDAKVKAEGLRLGLVDAHGELGEGEKITARYSLIMKEMGEAYGDVGRTADSYANTQRRAAAEAENLKASLGQQLLPIMADLSFVTTEAGKGLQGLSDSSGGFLEAIAKTSVVSMAADAIRSLKGESDDAGDATNYLADSQEILANAQDHTKEEVEKATAAIQAQQEALDRLLRATIAQFDSEEQYKLAVLGITDAIEDYDQALKTNSDGKAKNDLTASELTRKEIALSTALRDAGDAAVKQAEDQAAAAGKVLTESEKFDIFRGALIKLKEQFPQLAGQIDGYVARLDAVPEEVRTGVVADTSKAVASIQAIDTLLDNLSGRGPVNVQVNTTRTTRELFLPPSLGGTQKKAAGGYISGPGGPTDDLIPALLSNGEYVLRADAVKRLGVPMLDALNRSAIDVATNWLAGHTAARFADPTDVRWPAMVASGGAGDRLALFRQQRP
jgi:hypothetical protein